jgi:hypothetical protein
MYRTHGSRGGRNETPRLQTTLRVSKRYSESPNDTPSLQTTLRGSKRHSECPRRLIPNPPFPLHARVHAGAKRESAVPARERYIKYGPGSYRNVFYIRFRIFYIAGAKRERAVPAGAPLAPPSSPHSLALQAQRMVPAHRLSPTRRPYPAEWPKAAAGESARDRSCCQCRGVATASGLASSLAPSLGSVYTTRYTHTTTVTV